MKKFTRGAINAFLARHRSEAPTLDLGAAAGEHRAYFPNATAVDIAPERHPDIVSDAHHLPFPDASFEVVVCSEMLEHVENPTEVVQEIRRVLAPRGLLVLTTRFAYPVHDAPADYWRFTPAGLAKLCADFEVVERATDGGPFMAIAIQLQRIIFQTNVRGGKITKAILYLFALLFAQMDGLITHSYGDIKRETRVDQLLSSGVFIACRKK